MSNWIKPIGQVFHYRGDAAAAPARCENEVSQQKTECITDIQSDRCNTCPIRDAGSTSKSPGAETGHETA